jgi:hypothetical protein
MLRDLGGQEPQNRGECACDPWLKLLCEHVAVTNGTVCSTGNACNLAETCQAGVCTLATPDGGVVQDTFAPAARRRRGVVS